MSDMKIYTPEGVQDILGNGCYGKRKIESKILNLFASFGYEEIQTPIIEFYDTFAVEKDMMPQEKMFKFVDQQGRLLVLRPDMTIPVARVAATKLKQEQVQRFCYVGNAFRYNEFGGGKQKEFTQTGVELLGDKSPQSDAEVIVLAIQALLQSGLNEFQIDIGQTDFFKGITEETGLKPLQEENLRVCIDTKDTIGIKNFVEGSDMSSDLKQVILNLPELFGSVDVIDHAYEFRLSEKSKRALRNLREVLDIINGYGLSRYVSVDLGMVPALNYYTGVIFRGFTYGIGFPVLSGGRYDNLIEKFGYAKPATGFSVGVNMLMNALLRQYGSNFLEKPKTDMLFYTDRNCEQKGYDLTGYCRSKGYTVEVLFNLDDLDKMDLTKYKMLVKMEQENIIVTDVKNNEMIGFSKEQFIRTYSGRVS
ncbi:MAG TPA: ATP phosphoribosyltransferase regulatory subunit [Clostridiales bacterium]|nr:ATP phosphoribosyltransferase regulatory subunit [Clostridiales bacterium]